MESQPKKPLSVFVGLFVAEAICASAFVIELSRALAGNSLSWAYVFEWPVLGGYAIYMSRELWRGERPGSVSPVAPDDEALIQFNDYLAQVHQRPGSTNVAPDVARRSSPDRDGSPRERRE